MGGGALRFEWLPTAKKPCGAEVVNTNIKGWSTPFGAKKGSGQLQTKNIIGALANILYACNPLFYQIHGILYIESYVEDFRSLL